MRLRGWGLCFLLFFYFYILGLGWNVTDNFFRYIHIHTCLSVCLSCSVSTYPWSCCSSQTSSCLVVIWGWLEVDDVRQRYFSGVYKHSLTCIYTSAFFFPVNFLSTVCQLRKRLLLAHAGSLEYEILFFSTNPFFLLERKHLNLAFIFQHCGERAFPKTPKTWFFFLLT